MQTVFSSNSDLSDAGASLNTVFLRYYLDFIERTFMQVLERNEEYLKVLYLTCS